MFNSTCTVLEKKFNIEDIKGGRGQRGHQEGRLISTGGVRVRQEGVLLSYSTLNLKKNMTTYK